MRFGVLPVDPPKLFILHLEQLFGVALPDEIGVYLGGSGFLGYPYGNYLPG